MWETNWEKQQQRRERKQRKEGRTISGGISGLYTYKDESGGERVGLKGSARVNGKIVTDKNAYRKTDQFRFNADGTETSRKQKDQLSRAFNQGVDLTDKEKAALLRQKEDGSYVQKFSQSPGDGTASDREQIFGYALKLQDMTIKQQEATARLKKLNEERDQEEADKLELQEEKKKEERDAEDAEKGHIRPSGNDDGTTSSPMSDGISAESLGDNAPVRRSHVNTTIDEEMMQILSEIEDVGGGI